MTVTTESTLQRAAEARGAALGSELGPQARSCAPRGVIGGRVRHHPRRAATLRTTTEPNEQRIVRGVASVTDTPYDMWDKFGAYQEIVTRGAFTDTLAANPDVPFVVNHDGVPMARTSSKQTPLVLRMGDEGLEIEALVSPKRQDVRDILLAIEEGNLNQMSFKFMLEDGRWSEDFSQFHITRLDMDRGDVSVVTHGANPFTSIEARCQQVLMEADDLPVMAARALVERLSIRADMCPPESTPVQAPDPEPIAAAPQEASIAFYEALLDLT